MLLHRITYIFIDTSWVYNCNNVVAVLYNRTIKFLSQVTNHSALAKSQIIPKSIGINGCKYKFLFDGKLLYFRIFHLVFRLYDLKVLQCCIVGKIDQ